jgi:flavodoxin
MFQVVNYSRAAITKKMAEEIRNELRAAAKDTKAGNVLLDDPLTFISTGCYGLGRYCSQLQKRAY